MKLCLIGHDYKYAAEQIMLALFPLERPEYIYADPDERATTLSLSFGSTYAQALTLLRHNGSSSRGCARVKRVMLTDKLTTDRLLQRIIKQSFYRAAAKTMTSPPVWGSLTGIRPAKIIEPTLESGASNAYAARKLMREYYVSEERALLCADIARSSLTLKRSLEPHDIALYIGIPFCTTRCAYCSFVSNSVEKSFGLIDPYLEALKTEMNAKAKQINEKGLRIISVYIGGGTPTSVPAQAIESIMLTLKTSFDLSHAMEYTVEAGRPDTITEEKLDIIRRHGADRVCVNPQSMSETVLAAIGRMHSPKATLAAAQLVKNIGLALNMDIIAGLPSDSPAGFRRTLDAVLSIAPENITVHTLSQKKGSRIMLEQTKLPADADVAEMLEYASAGLKTHGYNPYYLYRQKFTSGGFENIGWSLPGFDGIYNRLMMEDLCTVYAMGAGGVTKEVLPGGRIERTFNAKYPDEYISRSVREETDQCHIRMISAE